MTLSALGIFSAAGAGGASVPGDYELISTTLLASATSDVTFSSLNALSTDFRHLQFRYSVRSTHNSGVDYMYLRANGQTVSSNYRDFWIRATGSNINTNRDYSLGNGALITTFPISTETENRFAAGQSQVMEAFSTTKQKSFLSMAGWASGSNREVYQSWQIFTATTALDSVTFRTTLGNFAINSRFSIYGLRA
jgi:hypothetical protein